MDDGCSPIIIIALLIVVIIEAVMLFIQYRKAKQNSNTEEEIISLVNEGQENGDILTSEAVMIQNIFEFSETDVKDVMVHRKNIVALDGQTTLREAISIINESHYSRYPVYGEDLDDILGIFHIKDALKLSCDEKNLDMTLIEIPDLLRKVDFVPETHGINTLFAKMQKSKNHMVVVMDEYGQVSGLLSMEDILEEIVGNIFDEHDEDDSSIEITADNSFIMDGSTTLEEAEEILGVNLSEDFETLNGYLVSLLGKIPEEGTSFELADDYFSYSVQNVTGKVIDGVVVKKLSE